MQFMEKAVGAALVLSANLQQMVGSGMGRLHRWAGRLRQRAAEEGTRADVPGWVLITLMSAVLVAGLLAIAGPALEGMFDQAMKQVNPG